MFLTADGESGKKFGNETIHVTDEGILTLTIPAALVAEMGIERLGIAAPVSISTHRGSEWVDRIAQNRAVRYDLHRDGRGRWYLDASWSYPEAPTIPLDALQAQRTLGVDLGDGHIDAAVVDPHGNVVGTPRRLDYTLDGTTRHRDAQVRHVVTRLIHAATQQGCVSISVENLLDPAYTSRWGRQHWLPALQTSDPTVDGHRAAAVVIGRRGCVFRVRRKPVGLHTRQRTRVDHSIGTVVRQIRASRSRVTSRPRAQDAAGPPDP